MGFSALNFNCLRTRIACDIKFSKGTEGSLNFARKLFKDFLSDTHVSAYDCAKAMKTTNGCWSLSSERMKQVDT